MSSNSPRLLRRCTTLAGAALLLVGAAAPAADAACRAPRGLTGQALVQFRLHTSPSEQRTALGRAHATTLRRLPRPGLRLVRLDRSRPAQSLCRLQADHRIVRAAAVKKGVVATAPTISGVTVSRPAGSRVVTVTASIATSGLSTSVRLDALNLGTSAGPVTLAGSSTATPVSLSITLPVGTSTLQLRAQNSVGTKLSSQLSVTVPALPAVGATTTTVEPDRVRVSAPITTYGEATTGWFEWGAGTALDRTTPVQTLASSGSQTVYASLLSLTPGTYSVRLAAKVGTTVVRGATTSVAVVAPAPTIAGTALTLSGPHAAHLAGSVTTAAAATTWFEWGVGTSFDHATPTTALAGSTSAQAVAADLASLTCGTTYQARIAVQVGTTITRGPAVSLAVPVVTPTVSAATASGVTATAASLGGGVDTQGMAADTWFEWGVGTAFDRATTTTTLAATSGTQAVAASLTGLTASTTYQVRVAVREGTTVTRGAAATVTTAAAIVTPTVSAATASLVGSTGAHLAGTVDTKGAAADTWFEWGVGTAFDRATPTTTLVAATGSRAVAADLSGLAASTTYQVRVAVRIGTAVTRGAAASLTTPAPAPTRRVLLGAWAAPEDGDTSQAGQQRAFTNLESDIARTLDVKHSYYPWTSPPITWREPWFIQSGSTPLVSWNGSASALTSINSGSQDSYIRSAAQRFKGLGAPVFLRFAWEMDAPTRGYVPADYIAAWRRLHSLFAAEGATNVSWVWCPNAWAFDAASGRHPLDWYPGDDVVDWTCADGYNWYPEQSSWTSFQKTFTSFYTWAATKAKPIMIGEFSSMEDPANATRKGQWYRDMAATVRCSWPKISAVVLYNERKSEQGVIRDWRIRTSTAATSGFRAAASDPLFGGTGAATACP